MLFEIKHFKAKFHSLLNSVISALCGLMQTLMLSSSTATLGRISYAIGAVPFFFFFFCCMSKTVNRERNSISILLPFQSNTVIFVSQDQLKPFFAEINAITYSHKLKIFDASHF